MPFKFVSFSRSTMILEDETADDANDDCNVLVLGREGFRNDVNKKYGFLFTSMLLVTVEKGECEMVEDDGDKDVFSMLLNGCSCIVLFNGVLKELFLIFGFTSIVVCVLLSCCS